MARSREKPIFEVLALAPWWVSVAVAVVVYVACKAAPSFLHSTSPALAGINVLATILAANAHWVALPFVIVSGIAALNRLRRQRLLSQQSDIESIRNLSWQEFELLVGEAFRQQGYSVEETGGGGADGGVDLRLRRDGKTYLVQCKRWKQRQVPVTAVRELFGLMAAEKAHGAFFVSCGLFTPDAKQFASDNGVVLLDADGLIELIGQTSVPPSAAEASIPPCPACGSPMVLRTAKRGANAGQQFWGCQSFPRCRGTVPG